MSDDELHRRAVTRLATIYLHQGNAAVTERNPALNYICRECGKTDNPENWLGGEKIAASGLCFHCKHWDDLLRIKDRPDVVRVDGVHYMIGTAKTPGRWNGFGGDRFKIKFRDGREAETVDLWCQGHIADHFKERMPDNAVFIVRAGFPSQNSVDGK